MSEETTTAHGPFDLVMRGQRILTTAGITAREVGVRNGVIVAIEPLGNGLQAPQVIELGDDETLIPGLVDTHVHVNEPGRTEWEGFASATRAAAAGGVTTIIDMPLNSIPPTTNVEGLKLKREVAEDQAFVDVGFWGGAIPGNKKDLRPLHDEGVFGFKCFLLHSGVDEFPHLDADEMEEDMAELKSFDSLMIVHAEDSHAIDHAPHPGGAHYSTFLASRPRGAENKAIAEVIERARWTGARAHILHLSSSDALPMIASAKRDGVHLTVETCPHYLTLMAEEIPDGATAYKCCPPIREASNRELLWQGLQDGTIDCIVSDHSPSTLDLKDLENGDFAVAWGGVSSLQLGLSLIWTEARHRGISLEQVVVLDVREAGSLGPPAQQRPARSRLRRRFLHLRARRRVRRRRQEAQAQEPDHAVRRQGALRRRTQNVPARQRDRRPDAQRQADPPRRRVRPQPWPSMSMPRTGSCPHGSTPRGTSPPPGPPRFGPGWLALGCSRAAWPCGYSPAKATRSILRFGPGPLKRSWPGPANLLRGRKSSFGPPPELQRPVMLQVRRLPIRARPTPLPTRLSPWPADAAAWQWTWPRTPSSSMVSPSASLRWNTASSAISWKTCPAPSHVKNCNAFWSHLTVPARHFAPSTCMLDASGANWAQPAMSSPQCVEAATSSRPDQAPQSADQRNTASKPPVTPID